MNTNPHFMTQLLITKDGVTCPCCGQFAKIYNRTVHSTMAKQLIKALKIGADKEYIHVSRLLFRGSSGTGDFPKAVYWGLIKEMPNDDPEKRSSGYWMLTNLGIEFVKGNVGIPKYARVYNGELLNPPFEGKTVYIKDCLGKKFDYQELMSYEL